MWGGGVVAEFFPLTAVTHPTFLLFKHILGFARIMSTLCPNVCRQTPRIGGGPLPPPAPPSRTPMPLSCVCLLVGWDYCRPNGYYEVDSVENMLD